MSELDTRQLRAFVAVAEELHFGRAAARLGIGQPPLSRTIKEVERMLGVRLFERSTRHVELTPAGEQLLADAKAALRAVTAATRRARHLGRVEAQLRVALKADYDAGLLPTILRHYETDSAALPLELVLGGRGEQVAALHEGRADVALLPTPFDDEDLDFEALLTEPRLVALAAGDPLAARDSLVLADLEGCVLPDGTPADEGLLPTAVTSWEDIGMETPSEGPSPTTPQGQLDLAQIFSLVELGRVVLFVPTSVAERYPRPDISFRPVADLVPATMCVAWPTLSRSSAVAAFVRAASHVAAERMADDTGDPDHSSDSGDVSDIGAPGEIDADADDALAAAAPPATTAATAAPAVVTH